MRLTEKGTRNLYEAIAEPIMDLRLRIQRSGSPSSEQMDDMLFMLNHDIWIKVHNSLNLKSIP